MNGEMEMRRRKKLYDGIEINECYIGQQG